MKIVESGGTFTVFDDGLKVYDELPPGYYEIGFSKFTGHFLKKHPGFKTSDKVYGPHFRKIDKILKTFTMMDDKLGVIFSGEKGSGKTLFLSILSQKAIEELGIPVIVINGQVPGMSSYLSKLSQSAVVVFDEFEKTFRDKQDKEGFNPQEDLLTMFDGLNLGKKLFIITCNSYTRLNSYMLNRPGRFHYHIQFKSPSEHDIREYLADNIDASNASQIEEVVKFSRIAKLNYDCLRAIAFEINAGEKFSDAITDLNIINMENYQYDAKLETDKQDVIVAHRIVLDLFSDYEEIRMYDYTNNAVVIIEIINANITPDDDLENALVVRRDNIKIKKVIPISGDRSKIDFEEFDKQYGGYIKEHMTELKIKRVADESIHYVRNASAWGVGVSSIEDEW